MTAFMRTYLLLACVSLLATLTHGLQTRVVPASSISHQSPHKLHTALARRCLSPSARRVSFALPDAGVAGGFGDRLLGMVTTYYVAMMTGSKFYVNWTRPYDLKDYFDVVDCTVFDQAGGGRRLINNPPHANGAINFDAPEVRAIDVWTYFENGNFLRDLDHDIRVATNSRHWQDVVLTPSLTDAACGLGVNTLSRHHLFKLALRSILLRPKHHVAAGARSVLHRLATASPPSSARPRTRWYVGVQIRCGSEGRLSWEDPARHSLIDVPCFVRETLRACGFREQCPIFLTSDSASVSTLFKAKLDRQTRDAAASGVPVPAVVIAEAKAPFCTQTGPTCPRWITTLPTHGCAPLWTGGCCSTRQRSSYHAAGLERQRHGHRRLRALPAGWN